MAKRNHQFQTIRTEGALLPPDILRRIASLKVEGATPDAFHLSPGSKLNEAISQSWTSLLNHWRAFQEVRANLPASELTATAVTNERWLLPLFKELDYGRLVTSKSPEIDERVYPIERFYNCTPIHLFGFKLPLDSRTKGARGAATASPHSMVQEFINRSDKHVWAFLSNGLQLRILRDNISLSRQAFVEFDLEAMMEGEVYADFALLWLLCHQSRVESDKAADCWLEKWSQLARDEGTRVLKDLRLGVAKSIEALGRGFIGHPRNDRLREKLLTGALSKQDYYRQLLRIVYRLLFLFVAEDRELLHPPLADEAGVANSEVANRDSASSPTGNSLLATRQLYDKHYSTRRLRELALKIRGSKHSDLWHSLSLVFDALGKNEGCPQLALSGLGSFLWRVNTTADLVGPHQQQSPSPDAGESRPSNLPLPLGEGRGEGDPVLITNDDLLQAIRELAYVEQDRVLRMVDYRNLGSEELGSVYEALLELHPVMNIEAKSFELLTAAGNERKITGSYYTPDSLVQCLLDTALEPVVETRLQEAKELASSQSRVGKKEERELPDWFRLIPNDEQNGLLATGYSLLAEQALLALKVCDPACGSGHFLIAAAHRLARHLARTRTGEIEPSPDDYQHALRDIIGRCVYGVDLNPMAVELCKVSLWMEAIEPGKPLSFLDHHIQCGNSLLGTTPALLTKGIPDDAFKPIEGDIKEVCNELKRENKRQRQEYESGQGYLFAPLFKLGNLPATLAKINVSTDESLGDIVAKQEMYERMVEGADYLNARLLADTWCAAFVWQKDKSDLGQLCPTERYFRNIENNPHSILPHVKSEVRRLAEQYQFFHWHLAFPDVFRLPGNGNTVENEKSGWNGGFDVVLGNPPWERIKLLEKEWFSTRSPEVAGAKTAALRRRKIADLAETDPQLFSEYSEAARVQESQSHFFRSSNRYPLCGVGEINTFAVFAEANEHLISESGRMGCVLPPGICTDDTYKQFVGELLDSRNLIAFYAFTNRGYIFPEVESTLSFSLLVIGYTNAHVFNVAAKLWQVSHLSDEGRMYQLSFDDIKLINPNTNNLPIFESKKDALIVSYLHRRFPILLNESSTSHPWDIHFQRMFDMSNDSDGFESYELLVDTFGPPIGNLFQNAIERMLPLYESKLVDQYNHRAATFQGTSVSERFRTRARTNESTLQQLCDPEYQNLSRYWVTASSVFERAYDRRWLIGFRNAISAVADSRSVVVAAVPLSGVGNSMPLFYCGEVDPIRGRYLIATLNSFVADYLIRQKASGGNLNYYILKQLAIPHPARFAEPCLWGRTTPFADWISSRVLELTYTAWDLESFASDCGYSGPPFRWDEERRFLLRCELDAAYFHLYLGSPSEWGKEKPVANSQVGSRDKETHSSATPNSLLATPLLEMFPTPRDAVDYIMETFPIVKRKDIKRTEIKNDSGEVTTEGTYIAKNTILKIYDEMQQAIDTGQPYQTRLAPPPGPPTDAEGNFIPMHQWDADNWPPHIHATREESEVAS